MATVTGLTAERMLAIEAESVVDGDVVGDNLILTKKDGSQINAGSVRGPQGVPGPIGSDLAVLAGVQIRAGRQLALTDFTNMGLAAPLGLWNLSDASDVSGNGRNLSTKGPVTFVPGINGLAATAAFFSSAGGQAFYIADAGAADPFRIRLGSYGCWFRTAQRGVTQIMIDKYGVAAQQAYSLYIHSSNVLQAGASPDGSANVPQVTGISDVCDDRWHFAVVTMDATAFKLYVDGILESSVAGTFYFPGSSPFNIGARGVTAAAAGTFQHLGRIDEVFITPEVLTDDEVRNLYCARVAHTLGVVPKRATMTVNRRRRGAALVVGDFPAQPVRLHNFSAGSMADEGSANVLLVNTGGVLGVAGADGTSPNAVNFTGTQYLSSNDAGLPAGLASRSYGCWFKTLSAAAATLINLGGTAVGTGDARVGISAGNIFFTSAADTVTGPFVADGRWHFAVVVEDNTATDNVKRKLYIDGKLVAVSTVMNAIVLNGVNRFSIGAANAGASQLYTGQIDAVFVSAQALTVEQISALYNKGTQTLAPSPKNVGDHVEAFSATSVLAIFDTLEMQSTIDLAVAA